MVSLRSFIGYQNPDSRVYEVGTLSLHARNRFSSMEINFGKLPFEIDFHPSIPLVAAGLISGDLLLYRYTADSPAQRLLEVHAHSESCRAVRFINDGRAIVTGSPDCSILSTDVETGSAIARLENSHGAAVNRIINLTDSTIASGDDEECVKVIEEEMDG